jgi:hypothetical protein
MVQDAHHRGALHPAKTVLAPHDHIGGDASLAIGRSGQGHHAGCR